MIDPATTYALMWLTCWLVVNPAGVHTMCQPVAVTAVGSMANCFARKAVLDTDESFKFALVCLPIRKLPVYEVGETK